MSLGRWGRRTSLISVQCEPLPVKPAGQGPQRAPLGVMVQATPGKQKSGAHWGSGRTLRPGLCTDCIPAREEGAVRATPLGGACRDHAQTAGGRGSPVPSSPLWWFFSFSLRFSPPPRTSRTASVSFCVSPSHSLRLPSLFLCLSLVHYLCQPRLSHLFSSLSPLLSVCFPTSSCFPAAPFLPPQLRSPHASHSITVFFRNVISLTCRAGKTRCG